MEHAVDGSSRDAVGSGYLCQTLPAPAIQEDRLAVQLQRLAPDLAAFEPGAAHAGLDSFDDQIPFELGDRADDDHDGPAQRAAGVDVLPEAYEFDAQAIQFVEQLEEMHHGPGDPVESPDQNDIETSAAGIGHHLIEARPLGFRATDSVRVLLRDLETALGGHLAQVIDLGLRVLVDAGDPQVKGGALHWRRPFGFGADGECFAT